LRQQGERTLRLGDFADVEKTTRAPAATEAWLGGRRGVAVGATMEPYHRIDYWASWAHAVVEKFQAEVPDGIRYEVLFDQSSYTNERLANLVWSLLGSAALVVGVLFFMMGVRSALLVATALPLTVAMALGGLNVLGVPLHQTSITGMGRTKKRAFGGPIRPEVTTPRGTSTWQDRRRRTQRPRDVASLPEAEAPRADALVVKPQARSSEGR